MKVGGGFDFNRGVWGSNNIADNSNKTMQYIFLYSYFPSKKKRQRVTFPLKQHKSDFELRINKLTTLFGLHLLRLHLS